LKILPSSKLNEHDILQNHATNVCYCMPNEDVVRIAHTDDISE